jgi:hypothetical protein
VAYERVKPTYKEHSEIRGTGAGPHWTVVDPTLNIEQGDSQVSMLDDFVFLVASQCDKC